VDTRNYGKKESHDAVAFEHPAKGPHQCSACEHYVGRHCTKVVDPISPDDWCRLFETR
jgi:hypothetical protein